MRRAFSFLLITAAAVVCLTTTRAQATTITSTTFANWKTSLTGSPTEADFTQIAYTSYSTPSGITLSAVGNSNVTFGFTGPDGSGWALNGARFGSFTSLEGGSDGSADINIALPSSGENAILLGLASTPSAPITVNLSDGETFTLSGNGLFGLSISHPISWLTVATSAGSQAVIDDFWYGTSSLTQDPTGTGSGSGSGIGTGNGVASAPEGVSVLLVSGGLLVLVGAYRKLDARNETSAA